MDECREKQVSLPVQKLMQQLLGQDAPGDLLNSLQNLEKVLVDNEGDKKLKELKNKMSSAIKQLGSDVQVKSDHPVGQEMHEHIAELESRVKLLKQKKERMGTLLVHLIGRYKIVREDNASLALQLQQFKSSDSTDGTCLTFLQQAHIHYPQPQDSDMVPAIPSPSFETQRGNTTVFQDSTQLFEKQQSSISNPHEDNVPLTPHPSFATSFRNLSINERMLSSMKEQIQQLQEQQAGVLEEQDKLDIEMEQEQQDEVVESVNEEDEGLHEGDEDLDEGNNEIAEKAAQLPSVFGNYGTEELQLYEQALAESRGMIIELENELMESKRREMKMVEARKKLEQVLMETQSSNVEVERELEIAEKKLEAEQVKARNLKTELEQLTKDHAIARKELYDEIRKLKRELGKSLKVSLKEGVDLEFEEFVDIAEYVEDEEDENKPLNTSISQGKKTKTFNKLISYWQTRSTGSFKLVRSQKPDQVTTAQQQTKSIDSNRKSIDSATSKMPSAQDCNSIMHDQKRGFLYSTTLFLVLKTLSTMEFSERMLQTSRTQQVLCYARYVGAYLSQLVFLPRTSIVTIARRDSSDHLGNKIKQCKADKILYSLGSSASVSGAQAEVISRFFLNVGTSENMSDCSKS